MRICWPEHLLGVSLSWALTEGWTARWQVEFPSTRCLMAQPDAMECE